MPTPLPFPRLDILPKAQQVVWAELNQIPPEFTLYGGTAIALYLGHRESVDFDFFGSEHFAPLDLFASLPLLKGASTTQSEANTLSVNVFRDGVPVKLSFFGLPSIKALVRPAVSSDNGLKIASMLDLAGMKVAVVSQRAEAKDYIDIDAIVNSGCVDLPTALSAAKAIYGNGFSPLSSLKAMTYFGEPSLSDLAVDIKNRLTQAVAKVDPSNLPHLADWRG